LAQLKEGVVMSYRLFPVCDFCAGRTSESVGAVVNAIDLAAADLPLRIGYHRSSNDSVSSATWTASQGRTKFVRELTLSDDVRSAWVRCIHDHAHYFVG
jgi:hypothetical protein